VGFPHADFKPDPKRKAGRVIDNEDLAKAWLAFIGFSDKAADRVVHFFEEDSNSDGDSLYELAFIRRPTPAHWKDFGSKIAFDEARTANLAVGQASVSEYMLAYLLWQFVRAFVPSPKEYREAALQEGHLEGKFTKASGSFQITSAQEDAFLATSTTYQTWRLMANMKELLVEAATLLLVRKYGPLDPGICRVLLSTFDVKEFLQLGDVKQSASLANKSMDLDKQAVISRIMCFLRYVSEQFWAAKQDSLLATSRIRTVLIKRSVAAEFKKEMFKREQFTALDEPWKPKGLTFLESLPPLSVPKG
jgi:hypothetical protein